MKSKTPVIIIGILAFLISANAVFAVGPIQGEMKATTSARPIKTILGRASLVGAVVSSKTATGLTVSKDGTTYTINITSSTQLRRRFWAKATLDEIQTGDTVNVHGKWTDDTKTAINAVLIRDVSIQKRFGAFVGTITSLTTDGWVMDTINRGNENVTVVSSTKYVDRQNVVITKSALKVGDRVRVKGLWDKTNSSITEVDHVKDYSLPVRTNTATSSGIAQ